MVRADCWFNVIVLLIAGDTITSLIQNRTHHDVNNDLKRIETRRDNFQKKSLSTSSESGNRGSGEDTEISLGVSSSSSTSSGLDLGHKPMSSDERKGWRKWHRKCTPCPDDMVKKWRDRSISWICGGYQRARRSFKSECMMHYRNCQDGTMFVKVHDYRCQNESGAELRHGLHFLYEYGRDSQNSNSKSVSRYSSSSAQISSEIY